MLVKEIMTRRENSERHGPCPDIATIMCFNKISGLPVVHAREAGRDDFRKGFLHAMFPKLQDFIANPSTPDFEQLEREYRDVVNLRSLIS